MSGPEKPQQSLSGADGLSFGHEQAAASGADQAASQARASEQARQVVDDEFDELKDDEPTLVRPESRYICVRYPCSLQPLCAIEIY